MNIIFLDMEFGPIYGSYRTDYFPTEIGAVVYDLESQKILFESKKFYYDVDLVIRKNIVDDIGKTVGFSEKVANSQRGEYQKKFDPSYRLKNSDKVIARKLRDKCLDELREYIHNLFNQHQVNEIILFGAGQDINLLKWAKVNMSSIQVIDIQRIINKEIGYLFSLDKISLIIGFYTKDKCFGSNNFHYKLPSRYKNQIKPHRALGDACRIFILFKELCSIESELVQQCNMYCEINKLPAKTNVNKIAVKETVYIETSIFGYLTARSTENLILAANSKVTQDWWEKCREDFDLYISFVVLDESALGDPEIATKRLEILESIQLLEPTETAQELTLQFLAKSNLPSKAANDAAHIALATVHGIDYLLTWNCKHIANVQIQKKLSQVCFEFGYELPRICTPYQLMGE